MKTNLKRLTALILALSMALSLLSTGAWAADLPEGTGTVAVQSEAEPQAEPEEEAGEPEAEPEPEEEPEAVEEAEPEEESEAEEEAEADEPEAEDEESARNEPGAGTTAQAGDSRSITVNSVEHGSVTAKVSGSAASSANVGDTVTLDIAPETSYRLKSLSVTYTDTKSETLSVTAAQVTGAYFTAVGDEFHPEIPGWYYTTQKGFGVSALDSRYKLQTIRIFSGAMNVSSFNRSALNVRNNNDSGAHVSWVTVSAKAVLPVAVAENEGVKSFTMPDGPVGISAVFEKTYTVDLSGGANATADGATSQSGLTSAMETVTYTANTGYYFEEFTDITSDGITVQRVSDEVVTVSGKPTADVSLTVPDATAKTPISRTVTFKVVGGAWDDNTTGDKTVTLSGYEGDTLKLAATDIPAVGTKPNDTYKAGSWDVMPNTDTAITEATIYTYTYVAKETSVVTKAPTAKTLTYNGQAQELVTAGTATGGEMQYALGTATEATQPYTTSIPTGTDAGTYYVWYKAKGDKNHKDSKPKAVTVTIAPEPQPVPQPKKKTDINNGLRASEKNGVVTLRYGEVSDADSYVVCFRYCGTGSQKPLMTVKGAKNTSVTIKRFGGKKINRKRSYTLWVVAKKGKKVLKTSVEVHVVGSRNKGLTNAASVSVKKPKVTLKKNKTSAIAATVKKARKGKFHKSRKVPPIRYFSSNRKVATVNRKGVIKAVGSGKCKIKVMALNGACTYVTVTVK